MAFIYYYTHESQSYPTVQSLFEVWEWLSNSHHTV